MELQILKATTENLTLFMINKKCKILDPVIMFQILMRFAKKENRKLKVNLKNMRKIMRAITDLSLKFLIVNINLFNQYLIKKFLPLIMGQNIMEHMLKLISLNIFLDKFFKKDKEVKA